MNTLPAAVAWTAGVVLLIPLIVVAGLIAIVAVPALAAGRLVTRRRAAHTRATVAPVVPLEAAHVQPTAHVQPRPLAADQQAA